MHINIKGLRCNYGELILTLNEEKIDIVSINEMFLRLKQKITIPGYYIVRKDRTSAHGGGADDIPSNTFELDTNNNRVNLVYVTIKINTKSHTELIICS